MPRLKLYFSYDGTYYSGWQRQKNTANTVQEILENKLSIIANARINVIASGRTDAGVHARIQVAHADVPEAVLNSSISRLTKGLNSLLPPDIRVFLIEQVPDHFHANADVQKKTYLYFIDPNYHQWPELRDHAWNLRFPLNWKAMEEATKAFVGEHDFKAYCAADSSAKTTVRTIYEIYWGTLHWRGIAGSCDLQVLRITGSGFLKQMVRSIVGSLVQIGNGKAPISRIQEALESQNRSLAGPTAPPHGLWLWDILYP